MSSFQGWGVRKAGPDDSVTLERTRLQAGDGVLTIWFLTFWLWFMRDTRAWRFGPRPCRVLYGRPLSRSSNICPLRTWVASNPLASRMVLASRRLIGIAGV